MLLPPGCYYEKRVPLPPLPPLRSLGFTLLLLPKTLPDICLRNGADEENIRGVCLSQFRSL